ncbi:MAG: EamA family transporter [Bacteroidales bacterium]|nr:EamA family transporter [Bacteroidales bacterium]MBQ1747878.1 EamA family transporter [Bacteroidales bacterium]MBQ1886445.1 EamA family transporter [Bacteroidales bacterium]MBR2135208.1 EamA family transporter [Bacteroidales bacterium]
MYKLILLSILQSACLVAGQMFLKFTMNRLDRLAFTWRCIKQLFTDINFLLCGICMGGASVLWFYILRNYPFSSAYPMISFSYVLGLIVAAVVFHEHIPAVRYVGVALIIIGAILVVQK